MDNKQVVYATEQFAWYDSMRETSPVHYDPQSEVWELFRYKDVWNALMAPGIFSSQIHWTAAGNRQQDELGRLLGMTLLFQDGETHRTLRKITQPDFQPRFIDSRQTVIVDVVDELLDRLQGKESVDLVRDFTFPLPVKVISRWLGIDESDEPLFHMWMTELFGVPLNTLAASPNPDEQERAIARRNKVIAEMQDYFSPYFSYYRSHRDSRVISHMVNSDALDQEGLLAYTLLLFIAGHITTTRLLSSTLLLLSEREQARWRIPKDEELGRKFVEETLRYWSPVQLVTREVREPVTVGNAHIAPGDHVILWLGSANRDPEQFASPDSFDLERDFSRVLAFGIGSHYCLGAPLARREAVIGLMRFLRRYPDYRVRNVVFPDRKRLIFFGPQEIDAVIAS
ncbi:MAG TPA: hypothetical protein DD856_04340 [Sulfobacillus sp.]|nr:hypothetical protein [Sulfobacillus sp.]